MAFGLPWIHTKTWKNLISNGRMGQNGKYGNNYMKNILVTGDRGYIGSALIPMLLENNYSVTGIDAEFFTDTVENEKSIAYEKITKDIRHVKEAGLSGIDAIIHLAALSNDPMGELDPELTDEINYHATINLAK